MSVTITLNPSLSFTRIKFHTFPPAQIDRLMTGFRNRKEKKSQISSNREELFEYIYVLTKAKIPGKI